MSIGHPIPEIRLFRNLTLKIPGQGHGWGESWKPQYGSNILSTHIPFFPCPSAIPFLIRLFQNLTLKSKVKVVGERNVESNKVGVTYYGLTSLSFHVNRPFHSWDTAFSKFQLENPRSRSNDHDVAQLQDQIRPWNLKWCKSIQQFQRYAFRKVWTQFVANLSSFWPMGKPIWCKWANDHGSAQLTLQAETIPQNFEWRKSVKRLQRYGFR